MGASQLSVYNKALRWLEERKLASLTENRESLRYMNDEWEDNILFCLSQGNWNFAMNEIELCASTTQAPNFGFIYAFPKPDDWNHTFMVSDNEAYSPLLRHYTDQANYWYSDITPLYIRYTSNTLGMNMALWTPAFTEYVAARLAFLCVPRLKQDAAKIEMVEKIHMRARATAMSTDSKDLPPQQPSYGTWVMSRAPRGSIVPLGNPFPGSLAD